MKFKNSDFPNVYSNNPQSFFTDNHFCESEYIGNILVHLSKVLGEHFQDYDFVIYSQNPQGTLAGFDFGKSGRKEVVFYLSDESSGIPHELIAGGAWAVFKNYLPSSLPYPNLFHLPLGFVNTTPELPVMALAIRPINVFFSGALHFTRLALYQHFTPFKFLPLKIWQRIYRYFYNRLNFDAYFPDSIIRFNTGGFKSGLDPAAYGTTLYNSKIVICPRGVVSYETFRHFEAMRAGCIIISDKLPETFFYTNSPIIQLSDWDGLDAIVRQILANPQEQIRRQAETLGWWENVCSEKAVARYIAKNLVALK